MTDLARLTAALAEHYAIEEELGAGGMATVYLAQDLKHGRKVAVKVIRPELAAVLGTERFLKEIEVTANLQHPHILPLFDSGIAHGIPYYVMPYFEGESLRDKLDRDTQLSIEESIAIAGAVGSALDYAHRHDVIHRDIKPANILLHDGEPIVADFGIALAVSAAGGQRLTETGLSIGTPEYMSPEQAIGGGTLDARSDEYALGCVLYEMLLGEPPHTGPTAQAVIAKVVTDEPRRVTGGRETVPAHVEFAIHRALAKLPADRFPDVAGFVTALTDPSTHERWLGSIPALVGTGTAKRWATRLAMAMLAAAAAWGWLRPSPPPQLRPVRFGVPYPGGELQGASRHALAVSPDGSHVVYVASGVGDPQLFLRAMDQLEAQVMPGTEGALDPFFSPDGQWVGFSTVVGLAKVPITGGPPSTIIEMSEPRGATWAEGGQILFGSYAGLWRVSAEGGSAEQITEIDADRGDRLHDLPVPLPEGRAILFTITGDVIEETQVALLDLASGEIRTLFPGIGPQYSPTGHIVYGRPDGVLMGVPFDAQSFELTGPAVPLVDGVTVKASGSMDFTISGNGTLVYLTGAANTGSVVMVDRQGNESPLIESPGVYFGPQFSPDGNRIAIGVGVPPTRQIWIYELADGTMSPLTFEGHNYYPVWNHDGTRIAFTTERAGMADLGWKAADGTGSIETLMSTGTFNYPESWSPDGRYLVFREQDAGTERDIWILPMEGERTPRRWLELPSQEEASQISPDGRRLAFGSDLSGQYEIYLTSFPEPGARTRISLDGGTEPVWSADATELFYRRGDETIVATLASGPEVRVLDRTVLFEGPYVEWRYHSNYDVHPDGQRFVVVRRGVEYGRVVVVLNWFEELRRLMSGP